MTYLLSFLAGALLCNAVPHVVAGLQGTPFPSPFGKPPGEGLSSPAVNFLWGALNLAGGTALLVWSPIAVGVNLPTLAFATGTLALGLALSRHFGGVRREK